MKLTLKPKPKPKTEHTYKCYRCGTISNKKEQYCPKCIQDGFQINMIIQMEN